MGKSSEQSRDNASVVGKRIIGFRERANSTRSAVKDVSEYDSTARLFRERIERTRERIEKNRERVERISERTEQNRAVTSENNRLAEGNTDGIAGIKQIAEQTRALIKAKEQELARARAPTRSRSPSMGM
ncbi:hypothetical protein JCM18903_3181 [Psychrobacter sp. JCM 18903]|nr:hypothetical protein JCM18903_3181 [Psychrobacter sp. JCM 18903]